MTLEELEARIRVLEDIEEVNKVMASYCHFVNVSQWDDVMALFADNAKADWGMLGTYEGKEGIATYFENMVAGIMPYTAHQMLNPIVTVEGNKAKGTFYLWAPTTVKMADVETAIWIQGRYDNEFVKEGGKWKFSLLRFAFDFMTPYEDGWVKSKMMMGG